MTSESVELAAGDSKPEFVILSERVVRLERGRGLFVLIGEPGKTTGETALIARMARGETPADTVRRILKAGNAKGLH